MTDRSRLIPLVDKMAGTNVLVIGDAMLDRFVTGDVDRISPEAPIPILRVLDERVMPGGAGNVVRNLAALGAEATFIGVIGADSAGAELQSSFEQQSGVDVRLIEDDTRPTTIKVRFVAGTQQLMRADWEADTSFSDAIDAALVEAVKDAISRCSAVVLSDYGKGVLAGENAAKFIAIAKDAGVPVIVDPKGADFARYKGADLVTPNRKELELAGQADAKDDAGVIATASSLIDAHGLGGMLVTRSADGMTLIDASGDALHLPAETLEVFDVSGAGDTVVATLAAMIGAGADRADAAAIANAAAGVVVGKVGTATAYVSELVAALHHQDISDAEAKVLTLDEADDRVQLWRRQGLRVGFTNGCFDLLHPGHVSLLTQARSACDRLIVGMNSDVSVRGLKGDDRPVQNEAARSAVLASLASVDLVVIFGDETPRALIEHLRPDVLVKGADYTVEQVVGADLVHGWGGEVVLADLKDGFSTTATIKRMNGASQSDAAND